MADLRVQGRATQGVRLINLEKKNDEIASVCKVDTDPEKIEEYIPEGEGLQQDLNFDADAENENIQDSELNENGDSQSYDQENETGNEASDE